MKTLALPNLWLLLALLLLLVVSPFLDKSDGTWIRVLFSLLMLSTVHVARHRRLELIAAAALAILWLALSWAEEAGLQRDLAPFTDMVLIALLTLTLVLVLVGTLSDGRVTVDTLCGAVAIYLLIGTTWAVTFSLLETLQPGSFHGLSEGGGSNWTELLYLSLTTLTTLGYGDIAPASAPARIWANLEAIFGVLYLSILVARLVSLYRN